MALTDSQRRELIGRFRRAVDRYAESAGAEMAAVFRQIGSLDESDMERFALLVVDQIDEISRRAGSSAAATTALLTETEAAAPVVVPPDTRGPFYQGWKALGNGEPLEVALEQAASRAEAAGQNAVATSVRRSAAGSAPDGTRWRRVPNAGACDWCVLVAQQTYHTAESADFGHDRCTCVVVPAG